MIDSIVNNFLIPFVTLAGPLLATALAALAVKLIYKLAAKAGIELDAQKEAALRGKIRGAILHTEQTFAKKLRAAKEDGKLTTSEAAQALGKTMQLSLKALGRDGVKILGNITGKGQAVLSEVIEEEVAALKLIPKA